MGIVATYSDLYSTQVIEKDEIIKSIKATNPYKLLLIGSYLLNHEKNPDELKKAYTIYLKTLMYPKGAEYLNNVYLYSLQGVLYTIKWVLANGIFDSLNFETEINPLDLHNFLTLQMMIADYLPKDITSKICYMHKNLSLNQKRNCKNDISRAFYIYGELAKKNEDYEVKEYLDFNRDFESKYGYSIETYLSVAFMLCDLHISDNPKYPTFELSRFTENLTDIDVAKKIIIEMSSDLETLISNQKLNHLDSWDFRLFNDSALIRLKDSFYVSISDRFILNRLFEGLYFNIRNIYDENDTSFNTFIGKVFENYISKISEYATKHSPLKYIFIDEFPLQNSTDNAKSSDTYIKLGKKLLVVEAKGYRPFEETLRLDDEKRLFEAVDKLLFKPIKQAINMNNRIVKENQNSDITSAEEIFFLSITFEKVQWLPEIYDYSDKKLYDIFAKKYKYLNLNIEEYEYLCGLIEKGEDVFNLLDEYFFDAKMDAFVNYLNHKYGRSYNSSLVDITFKNSSEKIYNILFHQSK